MTMLCHRQIPEVLLITLSKSAQRALQAFAVGVKQECRRVFRDIHRANIQSCIHLLKQVGDGIRMFLAVGADDHEQRSCGIVHDRGLILRQHRIRSLAHLEVIHFPFHSSGHQPLGDRPGTLPKGDGRCRIGSSNQVQPATDPKLRCTKIVSCRPSQITSTAFTAYP